MYIIVVRDSDVRGGSVGRKELNTNPTTPVTIRNSKYSFHKRSLFSYCRSRLYHQQPPPPPRILSFIFPGFSFTVLLKYTWQSILSSHNWIHTGLYKTLILLRITYLNEPKWWIVIEGGGLISWIAHHSAYLYLKLVIYM